MDRSAKWWLLLTVACVGGFLFIAGMLLHSEIALDRSHTAANAVITAVYPGVGHPGSLDAKFFVAGQKVTTNVGQPLFGPSYTVGQTVDIEYLPSDPTTARLKHNHEVLNLLTPFLIGGIAVWGYSWYQRRFGRGKRRRRADYY